MRITLDLDERLITKLKRVSGAKTRTEAIHLAAREYLYRRAVEGIKALRGKVPLADNWKTLRELEKHEG